MNHSRSTSKKSLEQIYIGSKNKEKYWSVEKGSKDIEEVIR